MSRFLSSGVVASRFAGLGLINQKGRFILKVGTVIKQEFDAKSLQEEVSGRKTAPFRAMFVENI